MNWPNLKPLKTSNHSSISNIHRLQSYFYQLPPKLIAQHPVSVRDQAKLLVINRDAGTIEHDTFEHLGRYLSCNSCLVVNNSKVIPARLLGRRSTGGAVEIFLLNPLEDGSLYEVLLRPLKKIREGEKIFFGENINAVLVDKGRRIVRFNKKNIIRSLKGVGHMPLPPYIQRPDNDQDRRDYQTVYAKRPGSVASPTAGLHFTKELIKSLQERGLRFLELTLHINYGTFKPVECADIRLHPMHTEHYSIGAGVKRSILKAKKDSQKLVAVGTTSCRVLESVGENAPLTGTTDLFIYPGFKFRMVDALITNFHLPGSTLLMLTCAFGGYDLVMEAYRQAIKRRYRFYSYGDAMLII